MVDVGELTGTWDYRELPSNIELGPGCFLERKGSFEGFRSIRQPGLVLGPNVTVYTWTGFSVEPEGVLEIGGDSVIVGGVFMCAEGIRLGQRVVVSYNVTVADCDFHPHDPDRRKQDAVANSPEGDRRTRPALVAHPVLIDDDVWIGIGATILKGVHVGRGARIGPGAVVTTNVPPSTVVAGNPARILPGRPDWL